MYSDVLPVSGGGIMVNVNVLRQSSDETVTRSSPYYGLCLVSSWWDQVQTSTKNLAGVAEPTMISPNNIYEKHNENVLHHNTQKGGFASIPLPPLIFLFLFLLC